MRKNEKIKNIELHGGIHTLEVGLLQQIPKAPGITPKNTTATKNTGQRMHLYHVNLNKLICDEIEYVPTWQDFVKLYAASVDPSGENTALIRRVDFRIDDYDHNYAEVRQINSATVRALASLKGCGKVYTSATIGSGEYHNIHVQSKGGGFAVECYDRRKKAGGKGLTHTRLELRSMPQDARLWDIPDLALDWIRELEFIKKEDFTNYYRRAQELANNDLLALREKQELSNRAGSITGFIREQQDNIYTACQMVELCGALGMSKQGAYNCGRKLELQYISQKEFADHISKIQSALSAFFGDNF